MSQENNILISEQVLQVPFNYSAGPYASRFLVALRDERKIYGIQCPGCKKVYVPPRQTCGECFLHMEDWVEVGPEGELLNFTEVNYKETVHPVEAPFIIGIIRLDGANTGLVHVVRGKGLSPGGRVRPVFAKKRKGHILDIECFEPVS